MDSVEGDRRGLIALYEQCNGENWPKKTNWLTDKPIEEWYGVKTNSAGRLIELELHSNNLTGRLPQEIGNWTQLQQYFREFTSRNRELDKTTPCGLRPSKLFHVLYSSLGSA